MHLCFGDVHSFLQDKDLPPSRLKLLEILDDPPQRRKLVMELAITVDAGEPFVRATYCLEGDGPLVFTVYEELTNLHATIANEHYPTVVAVAKDLTPVHSLNDQLLNYAKECVKPAYKYFKQKFEEDLAVPVSVFKCARLFDPSKIVDIQPTGTDIDTVRIFPFLNSDPIVNGLKSELPKYLASAEDVSPAVDRVGWWRRHEEDLPNWSKGCKDVLLIQPSSAAAERVFSILNNSFNERQNRSLQDYIEASVMLQYVTVSA